MMKGEREFTRVRVRLTVLIVCVVAIVFASFEAGRHSVDFQRRHLAVLLRESTSQRVSSARSDSESDTHKKIRLENLGGISFGELFDLMHEASSEQRQRWAQQLDALPQGPRKLAATEAFYKIMVQLDAAAAADLVLQIRDAAARKAALDGVLGAFREEDIEKIGAMLLKLRATVDRRINYSAIAVEWLQVNPAGALDFFERHRSELSDQDVDTFMYRWGMIDSAAARQWLEHQEPSQRTHSVVRGMVAGWFQVDPRAAVEYAAIHSEEKKFRDIINEIAGWIVRDFDERGTVFIETMAVPAREKLIAAVVARTQGRDYAYSADEATKWLVGLPNSMWAGHIDELLTAWETKGGEDLMYWLNELPADKRAQLLTEHSPKGEGIPAEKVLSSVMEIPERGARETALRKFAERLGATRDEAVHFLQHLPISPAQKQYVKSFLRFQ
jgi:hypothetical protein